MRQQLPRMARESADGQVHGSALEAVAEDLEAGANV